MKRKPMFTSTAQGSHFTQATTQTGISSRPRQRRAASCDAIPWLLMPLWPASHPQLPTPPASATPPTPAASAYGRQARHGLLRPPFVQHFPSAPTCFVRPLLLIGPDHVPMLRETFFSIVVSEKRLGQHSCIMPNKNGARLCLYTVTSNHLLPCLYIIVAGEYQWDYTRYETDTDNFIS